MSLGSFFEDKKKVESTQSANQQSSSNTGLSDQVKDYWSSISGLYSPSSWKDVDPNAYQTDAANRTSGYASGLEPAFTRANQIGGTGISGSDISRFMNPYTQSVVDATRANFAQENARQDAQTNANAAKLGALSGTQPLVARAISQTMRQPGQDAIVAKQYGDSFNTGANLANQSTGLQLQGLNSANAIAGQQSGINQTGFGQGTQLWNQDWQNARGANAQATQGAQVLASLSPQSGVTSTGSSTGTATNTTTASPSPFSVGANLAGMAISAYTGMPMPKPSANGGRVEMAAGGSVGIKPRESDPHHRLTTAFDAVRGMLERARGGSVLPRYDAGGSVGPSYNTSWNTTVTPAPQASSFDVKKFGEGLSAMGKPKDASGGGGDDGSGALRSAQQDLSSFMNQHSIRPGYAEGGEVDEYGGADGDLPAGHVRGVMKGYVPETSQNFTDPAKRVEGAPPRMRGASMGGGDGDSAGLTPAVMPSGSPGAPAVASFAGPSGPPAEKTWMQRNLPGLTEGVFDGKQMTPGQRLGTALMSVRGPQFEGPTNGIARSIMEMDGSRQKDDQIKNQVDQFGRTMGLKDREIKNQVDQFGQTKGLKERELALSENKNPAEIALLEAQAAAQRATQENGKYVPYDPEKGVLNARTGAITPPSQTGVNTQKIADEAYAKDTAKLLTTSVESSDNARSMIGNMREMKALSDNMYTGALVDQRLAAAKIGRLLGLDFDPSKISNSEQFQGKMQEFVLTAAQKLKPLSNSDITFVEKGMPGLARDPTTIGPMLESMERIAQRNILIEKYRQGYYSQGKRPDNEAIEARVDKEIPPPRLKDTPPTSGAGNGAGSTVGLSPAPSPEAAAQAETLRQKMLAMPDGSVVLIKGKPKIKQGEKFIDAPSDRYSKGVFSGYMDENYKPIPTFQ